MVVNMLPTSLWLLCLTATSARARSTVTSNPSSNSFYTGSFSTLSNVPTSDFSGSQYTYISEQGQTTVETSSSNRTATSTSSDSQITRTQKSHSVTLIGGLTPTANGTSSSTSSSARATNTVPCNGYPEFCNRQYSNITEVCAHNSAFVVQNNAASNQALPIEDQLNDGVRMRKSGTLFA